MSSEQSSRFIAIVDDDKWLHQVGSVLETLNQGVVISDEDRRIVFANSMFLEMSKMSAEEVLGRSVMDLYPPDDVARLQEFIARREAQGRARYEFYIPQADGGRLPVAVTSRLMHWGRLRPRHSERRSSGCRCLRRFGSRHQFGPRRQSHLLRNNGAD